MRNAPSHNQRLCPLKRLALSRDYSKSFFLVFREANMAMELSDEIRISAPRDVVYKALNDTEILKACIPGCEELTRTSANVLEAKVVLKIGPVKAKFGGTVTLDPKKAPSKFSLSGEGNGGIAGFAKGGADVELIEDGNETILRYTAKADVGGKMAQLGSRLIVSTSQKLAGMFFASFAEMVSK
jgi:uncharacterized protein